MFALILQQRYAENTLEIQEIVILAGNYWVDRYPQGGNTLAYILKSDQGLEKESLARLGKQSLARTGTVFFILQIDKGSGRYGAKGHQVEKLLGDWQEQKLSSEMMRDETRKVGARS